MSGEVQKRRNLKLDVDKIKSRVGDPEEFITVILHDFAAKNPDGTWDKGAKIELKVPMTPEEGERAREWEAQKKK